MAFCELPFGVSIGNFPQFEKVVTGHNGWLEQNKANYRGKNSRLPLATHIELGFEEMKNP